MATHFELHIEQGPLLESSNRKIGIVKGVQAYRWYTVTVTGQDCHTGTTNFENRADALLAVAKMILHSHRLATAKGALASTGILHLTPGSTNTVPGSVSFSLDIRAPADSTVEALEADVFADFAKIAAGEEVKGISEGTTRGRACEVKFTTDSASPAVSFHPDCIKAVTEAAGSALGEGAGDLTMEMVSGAGHDSVYASKICPSSMIFVPCRDGISHNPREFTSPEDCALGAQVLLQAVVRYDRMRAEKRVTWDY
jgi:hydantoinase/carbamoylase family amidase